MANISLFDFFKSKKLEPDNSKVVSNQIAVDINDGAIEYSDDSVNDTVISFDFKYNTQADLIDQYRDIASYNEVDYAIEDIINECVSFSEEDESIKLDLTNTELSESIKDKIQDKWDKICGLLDLEDTIHQRLRSFYIDGRLGYQKVVDPKGTSKGLLGVVELDSRNLTKVRNIHHNKDNGTIASIDEYFVYDDSASRSKKDTDKTTDNYKDALRLHKSSIVYVTSGLVDNKTGFAISWLHKAVKPANQLLMMENSLVVYRISRAPERRIFYVDVGKQSASKARQTLERLKNQYRNRMSYDPENGSFKDSRHLMTMQEDFWLPRDSSGKGTEVDTLPGGQNLSDIDDVLYFQKRLYKALNEPISRLEPDSSMMLGRQTEIGRDELKFSKFISKVRKRFNMMFVELLKTELILTKIITIDEWETIKNKIVFIYSQDLYLEEQKKFELIRDRLDLLDQYTDHIGKYVSHTYIRTDILKQTDEEQKEMDKQIAEELTDPRYAPPTEEE